MYGDGSASGWMQTSFADVSCGVVQLFGFCDRREASNEETLVDSLIALLSHPDYRITTRSFTIGVHFVFSDIAGTNGDKFGKWLKKKGERIVRIVGKNPNSGNRIVTYVWSPTVPGIRKKFPKEWKLVKEALALERKDREGYDGGRFW